MKSIRILSLLLLLAGIGCASSHTTSNTGAVPEGRSSSFSLRPYKVKTLSNGLQILILEDHSLPRVALGLMVKTGALQDPVKMAGLNAVTAATLEEGTTTRSAVQVADDFAALGTEFNVAAENDYTSFSTSGLALQQDQLLALFADVMLNPAFQEREVQQVKSKALASLQRIKDSPEAIAAQLFESYLYGDHPYARPVAGTPEGVKAMRRQDLIRHYFRYYRPNNSLLAVVGDISPEFMTKVQTLFSSWESHKQEELVEKKIENGDKALYRMVTKAGLAQTQIRIGHLGIQRSDPDFLALRAANIVLGGAFASRLNQKVRDELGLTYSISSYFEALKETGPFVITTFTRNDKVRETVQESLKVYRDFVAKGVTTEELEAAKALMKGQFPAALETPEKTAFNLMILRLYGISDSYLSQYIRNTDRLTLSQVNSAIQKHFFPDKVKVLIYGDDKALGSQLRALGNVEVQPLR